MPEYAVEASTISKGEKCRFQPSGEKVTVLFLLYFKTPCVNINAERYVNTLKTLTCQHQE